MPHLKPKYFAFSILSFLLVSPDSLMIRLGGFEGFASVFWRALGNFLGILTVVSLYYFFDKSFRNSFKLKKTHYFIAFCTGAAAICFVIAVEKTTVANVLILLTALPMVFSVFISKILLKENTPWQTLLACLMCILGTFILTDSNFKVSDLEVIFIIAFTCFCLALLVNLTKKSPHINTLPAYLLSSFVVSIIAFSFSSTEKLFYTDNISHYVFAISNGMIFQTGCQTCVSIGAKHTPSPVFSMLIVVELIIGIFLAFVFLQEIPNFSAILGGTIIIFTLVVHSYWLLKRKKPANNLSE